MSDIRGRNIEIKARLKDKAEFLSKFQIAKNLTSANVEILNQKDIFFNSVNGRLKLRYQEGQKALLVFYERIDMPGPKLSSYNTLEIAEPELLEKILNGSNGVKGIVRKKRFLFIYNQTRIHLDEVENLGYFIEFEVCLKLNQLTEEGKSIAEDMMQKFQIDTKDLLNGSYMDVLLNQTKT